MKSSNRKYISLSSKKNNVSKHIIFPTPFRTEIQPISFHQSDETVYFVKTFLEADIHLHKLRHPSLKTLFEKRKIDYPYKLSLVSSTSVEQCNSSTICQAVDDAIKKLHIGRENVALCLKRNTLYGQSWPYIEELIPEMMHTTCLAHLLHKACEKILAKFVSIDELISSIKLATCKNKYRQGQFSQAGLGMPPQPIVTRWGPWIEAAIFYSQNYDQV